MSKGKLGSIGKEDIHEQCEHLVKLKDEDKEVLNAFYSSQALLYNPLKAGSIDGTDTVAHDKAISRALDALYHPPLTKGNPEKTLLVARLNPRTTEQQMFEAFSEFGKIKTCKLIRCIVTGVSKRYGFVEYEEKYEAITAYRRGHKMTLDGSILLVDFECEHTLPYWIPRRLGGGLGGKKESGQLRFGSRDRPFQKPIPLIASSIGNSL